MRKRSEDQLVRFVWSRNIEYDYFLLLEVQDKNPFSFKKPKAIWEDIAAVLRMGHLKMRASERSCRERVNELLKKHRKDEGIIIRSTGTTEDTLTEIKKLLIPINEMASTQPQETHSSLYSKKVRTEGESIRDEALKCISSDSDDDYIHRKYPRSSGSRGSTLNRGYRNDDESNSVTNINSFFSDQNMSLAEEEEMLRQCALEIEVDSPTIDLDDIDSTGQSVRASEEHANQSWMDVPSTSRDHRYSVPLEILDDIDSTGQSVRASEEQANQSWMDVPSTSHDHRYSVPLEILDAVAIDLSDDYGETLTTAGNSSNTVLTVGRQSSTTVSTAVNRPLSTKSTAGNRPLTTASTAGNRPLTPVSTAGNQPLTTASTAGNRPLTTASTAGNRPLTTASTAVNRPLTTAATAGNRPLTPESTAGNQPLSTASTAGNRPLTTASTAGNAPSTVAAPKNNSQSNRFSNPKKDLVGYLDRKSEREMLYRKDEIRIREMEVKNKENEIEILRLKTIAENDHKIKMHEAEVQNRKEELQIQRLRAEAEAEERKQMLELLKKLISKNN